MAPRERREKQWYKLDNAGVLYSAIQKENYSAIYRFSAVMEERVDPDALQRAVDKTMPRFPGFAVHIKKGAFWYYFEPNPAPGPFVKRDISNPCQPVRFREDNGWLVRFYYYEHRISLEVFHALSDGAGALVFFRTLLAVYLREMGHAIPNGPGILDVEEPPHREELEDAYARYATVRSLRAGIGKKAFQNTGTPEPFYTLNVTMGFVPVDQLKARAKSYGVSITEYLTGALLKVILENQAREEPRHPKPVALAIPINLRPWFPSETLRNFILTVRPCIDPSLGEYTFPEILSQVHHYMRLHINRQEMQALLTGNVRFQTNRALQLIPIWLKNPVMALSYRLAGTRPYSGTYTNPGAFTVPEEMAPHIRRMEVILGQATNPRVHCASISYGNTMEITFAGTLQETDTEREFFRFLVREGIHVKVESNRSVQSELLF
ncbi:hypothetical protein I4200191B4_19070 [Pseudoflavonifractor gallinarum]|uniref:Alcohol acetyltransferase n=1 Tax=Pseudoflavonifractor hominis TaxID=2763059 RepID=A0ABR7HTU5_9FIRM|nr:hypothetical protein [Pseudoflavonifractor hominis]MBC5730923.1 hypothetical protein [Pseudoflavonifractor hominis]